MNLRANVTQRLLFSATSLLLIAFLGVSCSKDSNKKRKKSKSKSSKSNPGKQNKQSNQNFNDLKGKNLNYQWNTVSKGNTTTYTHMSKDDQAKITIIKTFLTQNSSVYEYRVQGANCGSTEIVRKNLSKFQLCSLLNNNNLHKKCAIKTRARTYRNHCPRSTYAMSTWQCTSTRKLKTKKGKVKKLFGTKTHTTPKIEISNIGRGHKNLFKKRTVVLRAPNKKGKLKRRRFIAKFGHEAGITGIHLQPRKSNKTNLRLTAAASANVMSLNYVSDGITVNVSCGLTGLDGRKPCKGEVISSGDKAEINQETFDEGGRPNSLGIETEDYDFEFKLDPLSTGSDNLEYEMTVHNNSKSDNENELTFIKTVNNLTVLWQNDRTTLDVNCKLLK